MPISLIACVVKHRNNLVIGKNNDLLVKLPKDMAFFRTITSNQIQELPNIVLMGRNTYYSIQSEYRPLKNRLNFVLTKDPVYLKKYPLPKHIKHLSTNNVYFITLLQFQEFYIKFNPNVFVIGGGQIYETFINNKVFLIDKMYITEVKGLKITDDTNLITMPHFDFRYKLIGYSEKYNESKNNISYRILTYKYVNQGTQEHLYFDLASNILRNGKEREDRTGTGTISLFGTQLRFDISSSIPLLTTKQVPFNSIVKELLWILQGNTDAKILQRQNVTIWDGNTSREFLDNCGLEHYPEGVLGAGYGFQLRFQGAKYSPAFADTNKCDTSKIGGVDQLQYIEYLLLNDPFSRRIMFSYWNPSDFDKTALLPCHVMCQFYVTEEKCEKYLSCMFIMRSNDIFLGNPFNLVFYSLLTYILAKRCNMKPKELVYTCGDTHLYKNHLTKVKEQLTRVPRPLPCVKLDESIKTKDWKDITIEDFDLIGYFSHPSIKAPMAI